jgi:hypothetical protein
MVERQRAEGLQTTRLSVAQFHAYFCKLHSEPLRLKCTIDVRRHSPCAGRRDKPGAGSVATSLCPQMCSIGRASEMN